MDRCPCGSGLDGEACCRALHAGRREADTAEALMRSRYSAFVVEDIAYLLATHDPETREVVDERSLAEWARSAEWLGLDILDRVEGGPEDSEGVVEFRARYKSGAAEVEHHERSRFRRVDGRWRYVDGAAPERRPAPRVGRNEPCACGSGKKFKKCCGR